MNLSRKECCLLAAHVETKLAAAALTCAALQQPQPVVQPLPLKSSRYFPQSKNHPKGASPGRFSAQLKIYGIRTKDAASS
ncbi:MAG: hypothetical protein ACLUOF_07005 [Ruminococcus sp.]